MAFRFRQFVVEDDRSTMPVGTDAMLLGSWTDPGNTATVLDIGTGCGVLSLMMAQKSTATVSAIDIDPDSVRQAQLNFARSPWGDRLSCACISVVEFARSAPGGFDLIISNPPFHSRSLLSPSAKKNLAKHEMALPQGVLLDCVSHLLSDSGCFTTILPLTAFEGFASKAAGKGLTAERITLVRSFPHKKYVRVLASFSKSARDASAEQELFIFDAPGKYSHEYLEMTSEFHYF